jgi:hypothetical protein
LQLKYPIALPLIIKENLAERKDNLNPVTKIWNLDHTSNFEEKIVIINIHTNNVPKGLIERPTKVLCKDLINNNNIFVVKKNPPEPYELEERHTY